MTAKKKGPYIKQGRPFTAPPVKYKATIEIEDWEFPRLTPYDVNEMIRDALSCYFQVNKVDSEKVKVNAKVRNNSPKQVHKATPQRKMLSL